MNFIVLFNNNWDPNIYYYEINSSNSSNVDIPSERTIACAKKKCVKPSSAMYSKKESLNNIGQLQKKELRCKVREASDYKDKKEGGRFGL